MEKMVQQAEIIYILDFKLKVLDKLSGDLDPTQRVKLQETLDKLNQCIAYQEVQKLVA